MASDINIDESKHVPVPSLLQRFKDAVWAVVMGIILVQMYYFYRAVKGHAFGITSVVLLFDNIFFLVYLGGCAVLGWFEGRKFSDWLNVRASSYKFW